MIGTDITCTLDIWLAADRKFISLTKCLKLLFVSPVPFLLPILLPPLPQSTLSHIVDVKTKEKQKRKRIKDAILMIDHDEQNVRKGTCFLEGVRGRE